MQKSLSLAKNIKNNAALFILFATMFLVMAGFGIITPFFPFLAKDMGASSFDLGLMVALFSLAQALAAPVWGRLSDRLGRKRVLVIGLAGYAISYYLLILAPNLELLMASRVLGGLLSASTFPSAQAYLVDITSDAQRDAGMSYMAAAANLGYVLGPALGGIFSAFGIRIAFTIGGTIILVTSLFAQVLLPAVHNRHVQPVESDRRSSREISSAVLGRDSSLFWITLLISFGSITIYSLLGYYMIDKFSALATDVVIVYTLMGGISVILQVFVVGKGLKMFGDELVILFSLILGATGFLGLVYSPNRLTLYAGILIIATSLALVRPAILVALSRKTRLGQGLAMGLQGSFDSFGRVVGPLWAGWIYGFSISLPFWSSVTAFIAAALVQVGVYRSR